MWDIWDGKGVLGVKVHFDTSAQVGQQDWSGSAVLETLQYWFHDVSLGKKEKI
jgi:hypothetical protein